MALVEETATYLDGPGRVESKNLARAGALAYATESMRLTTRLMQLASWLLLHRAVKEGEMSLSQANKEKTKVKLSASDHHDPNNIELLPETLRALIERSQKLHGKVRRLDASIHDHNAPSRAAAENPVERQLGLLKAAFGAESA
jgi:regulator of CtrA degradation